MKSVFQRRLTGVLLLLSMVFAVVGCDQKNSADDHEKVLHIGATGQSFPNSYKENNELTGFDVEVANTIAQDLGYKVVWTTADFSGLLGQLEAGKLDTVANNFVVTAKRQEKYNYSDRYLSYATQIVTSDKNTNINTLEDLKGHTVAGVLGSNHVANLQKAFPDHSVTIRTYEARDGAMNDALNNRVQGYANSRPILLAEIKKHHLPFKTVGGPLSDEDVAFPFAKTAQGDELREAFNQELAKMRADGRLKAISTKYFGSDLTEKN